MLEVRELTTDEDLRQSFKLRAQVYVDEWALLPPECAVDGLETDELDPICRHGGVFAREKLVGTVRVIPGELVELPVAAEFGIAVQSPAVEISRFIVHPQFRGTRAMLHLVGLSINLTLALGAEHAYAMVESWWLSQLQAVGVPFRPISEPVFTFNSENVAVYVAMAEVREHGLAAKLARRSSRSERRSTPVDSSTR